MKEGFVLEKALHAEVAFLRDVKNPMSASVARSWDSISPESLSKGCRKKRSGVDWAVFAYGHANWVESACGGCG